jgi:mannose-6-phosphate isomerase
MNEVLVLANRIQNYAWGSRSVISELLGRPTPSPLPEAEMWIGAHPKAPSEITAPPGLGTLEDAIEADPVGVLGASSCDHFGNQLPFLFKVLAAAEPLSIQAHPSHEQARQGWDRENAEGIAIDAPRRNYRDPNHKPELVCALTPFTALKGFRPLDEIVRNLEPVARPELARELGRLAHEKTPAALRALLARLLTLEPDERRPVLERTATQAARRAGDPAWCWTGRLRERYPQDAGVLAPLYLHLVVLAPGQALFLPAGELHAYLEGAALEIMANSDNVLRGGLTPKHIDVPELLATLVFEPHSPELLHAVEIGPGERVYRTPAREFELGEIEVSRERPFQAAAGREVEILLGLAGDTTLLAEGRTTPLGRGCSVLVPATFPAYTIAGDGRVARARVPT